MRRYGQVELRIYIIMASISSYFSLDNSLYPASGIKFYKFDDSQSANFIADCFIPFREAYIEEAKLVQNVATYGTTRYEEIAERLPDPGDVMSGDFGEILTFYLACQIWSQNANVFPMKWRLKDKKKAASPYTDVMLFELHDPAVPSTNDSMITYEVKTRATALGNTTYKVHKRKSFITYKDGKLECTFIEAVFDANKDAVERAAETIPYLKTRCKDLNLTDLYTKINRFSNGVSVSYRKEHNAVAVIDTSTLADQINRLPPDLFTVHPGVSNVFCVPIDNLKAIYENIYSNMPSNA